MLSSLENTGVYSNLPCPPSIENILVCVADMVVFEDGLNKGKQNFPAYYHAAINL